MLGLTIRSYQIESLVAEGGMGQVYLARHGAIGRKAAIKIMRMDLLHHAASCSRFMAEARIANAIGHPNIIDILDVGLLPDGRTPYLMMEYLEGETLAARIARRGPLAASEAMEIAYQVALALGAAHAAGVIHRDIKPENLYLVPDNTLELGMRVKVLDFGVAKLCEDDRGSDSRTRTGALLGTVTYMSPEQCSGFPEKVDHRTDIYSLGIVLYQMLSGRPPFSSEGQGDLLLQHMVKAPPALGEGRGERPSGLEAIVMKAIAKRPEDRFPSMESLQGALFPERVAKTGSELCPTPLPVIDSPETRTHADETKAPCPATLTESAPRRHRPMLWVAVPLLALVVLWFALRQLTARAVATTPMPSAAAQKVVPTAAEWTASPPVPAIPEMPSVASKTVSQVARPARPQKARTRELQPTAPLESSSPTEPLPRQGGLRW